MTHACARYRSLIFPNEHLQLQITLHYKKWNIWLACIFLAKGKRKWIGIKYIILPLLYQALRIAWAVGLKVRERSLSWVDLGEKHLLSLYLSFLCLPFSLSVPRIKTTEYIGWLSAYSLVSDECSWIKKLKEFAKNLSPQKNVFPLWPMNFSRFAKFVYLWKINSSLPIPNCPPDKFIT